MLVISLIRPHCLSFANFCAPNSLKVAKERSPFFRLKVESACFDFISFFSKGANIVKGWEIHLSAYTSKYIVSAHEREEIYLQLCI